MEIEIGGAKLVLPDDASEEAIKSAVTEFRSSPDFDRIVDKRTGAPARVRQIVGASPQQDRLTNIQRFYPDALPYGEDNFVFTDPATGKPTLYNPKGLDFGDAASVAREGMQMVGAGLGATFGAAGGLAVGAPTGPGALLTGSAGAAAGAGLGSAAAGSLYDSIAGVTQGTVDTRTIPQKAGDIGLDVAGGAVGQRAGELLGAGVKRVAGGGTQLARDIVGKFQSLGIEPTAGSISTPAAQMTQALRVAPAAAVEMEKQATRVLGQTKAAADRVTAEFGTPLTPQGAGEVIRQAAVNAAERFRFTQERAYQEAFDIIGENTPVAVGSVTTLREALEAELSQAPRALKSGLQPAIGMLRQIEADAARGGIPFSALRQVRTMIGKDIDNPLLAGSTGAQNEAMKRVYGALTEDLSAAAKASSPDAAKKLAVADRFTRIWMNQVAGTMQKIADFDADELAFRYAMSRAQDGGTQLARLRRNFQPEEWDTVAASVLGRLGMARPGAQDATGEAFSVNTFMTNWNKLAPEAKEALFGGTRYKDAREVLDTLVEVTGSLKAVEKWANTSNTSTALIAYSTVQAGVFALGGLVTGQDAGASAAAGIVAPWVAAKLITSPAFLRWLTTPVTSPGALSAHVGRLAAIAKAEPEIREEIAAFATALRDAPVAGTPRQRAKATVRSITE